MTRHRTRFGAHPWEFAASATEQDRAEQAAYRAMLQTTQGLEVGEGGYLSPQAHILGRKISMGDNCLVADGVRLDGEVTAGNSCSFNLNATVAGRIRMGNDVRVAAGAGLWGFDHVHDDPDVPITRQGVTSSGIDIGDDVWIGANAIVTDGVRIGSHVVIAA